jgi:hypothetical protein
VVVPTVEVAYTANGDEPPDEPDEPVPAHSPLGRRKQPEVRAIPLAKVLVPVPWTTRCPVVVAPPKMVRPPICVPSPIVVEPVMRAFDAKRLVAVSAVDDE